MKAAEYDAWYDSPRGRWIGETEYRLLLDQLEPQPGDHVLDVGCGTGWFTRRFAALPGLHVTGIDLDAEWLEFACGRDAMATYAGADARALPFADGRFDLVVSVTALGFIPDWRSALNEMLRVTRGRFAVGVLNRGSLLWREKGQGGGSDAYRGAHWHTNGEIRSELDRLQAQDIRFRSAIFLPSGSQIARMAEQLLPSLLPWGGLTVVSGAAPRVRRR
jgi:ubiquinone/menaquinone biosynthesis C-methylase UbiE